LWQGGAPVLLPANGRLIVHLVPWSAFGQTTQIDLKRAWQIRRQFLPMGADSMNHRFNLDGFINVRGGHECHGYAQIFRNGIVEATKANILEEWEGSNILHESITAKIVECVPHYFDGLQMLDVPPPIVLMVSFQGVAGAKLGMKGWDNRLDKVQPIPQVESVLLPEVIVDDYGSSQDYERKLRPIFDALWNAAGFPECTDYDADGNWKPPH
jgi:hypothetical protein